MRAWILVSLSLSLPVRAETPLALDAEHSGLVTRAGATSLELELRSSEIRPLEAVVRASVVDPDDRLVATARATALLRPGRNAIGLGLPGLDGLEGYAREHLPWYRLGVTVEPLPGSEAFESLRAVTSAGRYMKDAFALEVTVADEVRAGGRLPVWVRARSLVDEFPVPGVELSAELEGASGAPGVTFGDGSALLMLRAPERPGDEESELVVTGRRGDWTHVARTTIQIIGGFEVALATDKPVYRPGQVVRFRALARAADGPALGDAELAFTVKQLEEHRYLWRERIATSCFGVAHGAWTIPESAEPGHYLLEVAAAGDDDDDDDELDDVVFQVEPYELPSFLVKAEASQPFYLAGDPAEVAIAATTLAGAPLAGLDVAIFEDDPYDWWRRAAPAPDAPPVWSGVTGADGRARAPLGLAEARGDVAEEDDPPYADARFIARVTDPTSLRDVDRRFALRASREPLHVYFNAEGWSTPLGLEPRGHVAVFTADGSPVESTVAVAAKLAGGREWTTTLATNRLGLARLVLPAATARDEIELRLVATDAEGRSGSSRDELWIDTSDEGEVRLRAADHLLAPGQALELELETAPPGGATAVVLVSGSSGFAAAYTAELAQGRGRLSVPYRPELAGELRLAAFLPAALEADDSFDVATLSVFYPERRRLELAARVDPAEARPGDPVELSFRVSDAGPVAAALGLLVLDGAYEAYLEEEGLGAAVSHFLTRTADRSRWEPTFAGLERADLAHLDPEAPADLHMVAELLSRNERAYWNVAAMRESPYEINERLYAWETRHRLAPAAQALDRLAMASAGQFPSDSSALEAALTASGVGLGLDPWERPYQVAFELEGLKRGLEVFSPGPDGKARTGDDLSGLESSWDVAQPLGEACERAILARERREGSWIVTVAELRAELEPLELAPASFIDPWGRPFELKVAVEGAEIIVEVVSAGEDGILTPDDGMAWRVRVDSFAAQRPRVGEALTSWVESGRSFPRSERTFRRALARAGIDAAELVDPLGRPYRIDFGERRSFEKVQRLGRAREGLRIEDRPTSALIRYVHILGISQYPWAENVARYDSRPIEIEVLARTLWPKDRRGRGSWGVIRGRVLDADRLPLPGATIDVSGTMAVRAASAEDGSFALALEPGRYSVLFELAGFNSVVREGVVLRAGEVVEIEVELGLGEGVEVAVIGAAPIVELNATTTAAYMTGITPTELPATAAPDRGPSFTPRLRHDFPEVMLWLPELETDDFGRATVALDLADAVTTWKLQAVASTLDGRLATAEVPIVASLPFYLELDPPQVLTRGDRLELPAIVRNFTDGTRQVELSLRSGEGLEAAGPTATEVEVAAGGAARAVFSLEATGIAPEAPVQVQALAGLESDAIEKTLEIQPYGELVSSSRGLVLERRARLRLDVPADAIADTAEAELVVFPNLEAHIAECLAGLQRQPLGCGEQITSAASVNLVYLRALERRGRGQGEAAAQARRRLESAVDGLTSVAVHSGGFSYFAGGAASLELTPYVLQFLAEASPVAPAPEGLEARALAWLLDQQAEDGRWESARFGGPRTPRDADVSLTAHVARSLGRVSAARRLPGASAGRFSPAGLDARLAGALGHALDYLEECGQGQGEPYVLASYVLAASAAGRTAEASEAAEVLAGLAVATDGLLHWEPRFTTPLHGWGLSGRIETTALALQALEAVGGHADRVDQALQFLLQRKDPYSMWWTTSASVASIEALIAAVADEAPTPAGELVVSAVDGRSARAALPASGEVASAIRLDLSALVGPGENVLELASSGASASAELVARHHRPWPDAAAGSWGSEMFTFDVAFDRLEAAAGEEVNVTITTERLLASASMMLVAEIGLPPGAEVDRRSLEAALRRLWGHYEVRPTSVVLYLWAGSEPRQLDFSFRPRFAGELWSPPSTIYDYYNPAERRVQAPLRFRFSEPAGPR